MKNSELTPYIRPYVKSLIELDHLVEENAPIVEVREITVELNNSTENLYQFLFSKGFSEEFLLEFFSDLDSFIYEKQINCEEELIRTSISRFVITATMYASAALKDELFKRL